MPFLKQFTSGPFQTNAFLVGWDNAPGVVLIDAPPDSFDLVMAALKTTQCSLEAVLITHPHLDHILDAAHFQAQGIPIVALEEAGESMKNPSTLGFMSPHQLPCVTVDKTVAEGDVISYAGMDFHVSAVPGHCHGSASYTLAEASLCFVGDVIFCGSVGRTDLPGGDFDLLEQSIRKKIYTMPECTVLYPGHGPSTTVGKEKRENPYVTG